MYKGDTSKGDLQDGEADATAAGAALVPHPIEFLHPTGRRTPGLRVAWRGQRRRARRSDRAAGLATITTPPEGSPEAAGRSS